MVILEENRPNPGLTFLFPPVLTERRENASPFKLFCKEVLWTVIE